MQEWTKKMEAEGYTCIPNPIGDGVLCYKDYVSFVRVMLNCRICPNCLIPLNKTHWWNREMKCSKCGWGS